MCIRWQKYKMSLNCMVLRGLTMWKVNLVCQVLYIINTRKMSIPAYTSCIFLACTFISMCQKQKLDSVQRVVNMSICDYFYAPCISLSTTCLHLVVKLCSLNILQWMECSFRQDPAVLHTELHKQLLLGLPELIS